MLEYEVDGEIRDRLEKIADRVIERYESAIRRSFDPEETRKWIEKCNGIRKDDVYRVYGESFKKVDDLSNDELWDFISKFLNLKENCHWVGLTYRKGVIKAQISKLRQAIKTAISYAEGREGYNLKEVLEKFAQIKNVGPAKATPILHVMYPDRFAVLNKKVCGALRKIMSEDEMRMIGIEGGCKDASIQSTWVHNYPIVNSLAHILVNRIKDKYDLKEYGLWEVDALWGFISDEKNSNKSDAHGGDYEMNIDENDYKRKIEASLEMKKQVILYGPPGTGKTWMALQYAKSRGATKENGRLEFVTFHPSFSYEDFVEGIRPESNDKKELTFEKESGIFKRIAMDAFNTLMEYLGRDERWEEGKDVPEVTLFDEEKEKIKDAPAYYLIIDEINRGDISKIFGELITLLEKDKRLFGKNEITATLPYSKTTFGVPPNLYIIGTMNTADRSIALMDVALRRRFAFVEMMPDMNLLREELGTDGIVGKAIDALEKLNERIRKEYDRDHQIGHSYYLQLKDLSGSDLEGKLQYIWLYEILPLLQEYFYGNDEKIQKVLFKCDDEKADIFECYRNKIEEDVERFLYEIIQSESAGA